MHSLFPNYRLDFEKDFKMKTLILILEESWLSKVALWLLGAEYVSKNYSLEENSEKKNHLLSIAIEKNIEGNTDQKYLNQRELSQRDIEHRGMKNRDSSDRSFDPVQSADGGQPNDIAQGENYFRKLPTNFNSSLVYRGSALNSEPITEMHAEPLGEKVSGSDSRKMLEDGSIVNFFQQTKAYIKNSEKKNRVTNPVVQSKTISVQKQLENPDHKGDVNNNKRNDNLSRTAKPNYRQGTSKARAQELVNLVMGKTDIADDLRAEEEDRWSLSSFNSRLRLDKDYQHRVVLVAKNVLKNMSQQDMADFIYDLEPDLRDNLVSELNLPLSIQGILAGKKKLELNGLRPNHEQQKEIKEFTSYLRQKRETNQ